MPRLQEHNDRLLCAYRTSTVDHGPLRGALIFQWDCSCAHRPNVGGIMGRYGLCWSHLHAGVWYQMQPGNGTPSAPALAANLGSCVRDLRELQARLEKEFRPWRDLADEMESINKPKGSIIGRVDVSKPIPPGLSTKLTETGRMSYNKPRSLLNDAQRAFERPRPRPSSLQQHQNDILRADNLALLARIEFLEKHIEVLKLETRGQSAAEGARPKLKGIVIQCQNDENY